MKAALIGIVVIAAGACIGGSKYFSVKSDLMKARTTVNDQWSDVDAALRQRAELIPRVVTAVKGVAAQESGVYSALSGACASLAQAKTHEERIAASVQLDAAVARLLVMAENYPQLRSKHTFLPLEDELTETENHFLLARRKYNEALEHYNVEIQKFPANVVAGIAGFTRNDAYFKTEPGAREFPKVQF